MNKSIPRHNTQQFVQESYGLWTKNAKKSPTLIDYRPETINKDVRNVESEPIEGSNRGNNLE